ncbi:MAG: crotonase/enoyl-CoA hydratase family protein [Rubrimonas sp.]|uniref:crotonase/enoyl-CoA hydratase family protein n=1 Tax=Rubrimonas sp. TaxID=2036015 RepID=UPI002FDCBF33
MTGFETLRLETDARGVARLTLNRPDKRNALSARMIAELTEAAARLAADAAVRVVALDGAGTTFCAGGDLDWMRAQFDATRAERIAQAMALARMLQALDALPKPLIGRVHGAALGGGAGLCAVCDAVVAAADARFGFTETRLGLIPATIGPYVIARIGAGPARRVFFSGATFDAAEAERLGLVAQIAPPEALDAAVEAAVAPYLAAAPGAVSRAKALARALGPRIDETTLRMSVEALADAWEDPEAQEGVAAFFARRKPHWSF